MSSIRKIAMYECQIEVKRIYSNGNIYHEIISSKDLVPGDLAVIPDENIMPCDMILMNGSCVYGLVTRTGFLTTKGGLVREILFPSIIREDFYYHSMIFVAMFTVLFFVAFASTVKSLID